MPSDILKARRNEANWSSIIDDVTRLFFTETVFGLMGLSSVDFDPYYIVRRNVIRPTATGRNVFSPPFPAQEFSSSILLPSTLEVTE